MLKWWLLGLAVVVEVCGALLLKASDGFTRIWPTIGVLAGYGLAFFLESRVIALGVRVAVTYAIWSGAGILLITVAAGCCSYAVTPTMIAGMALIVVGVVLTASGTH